MKSIVFILVLFTGLSVNAQRTDYLRNHFSVALVNGLVTSKSKIISGTQKIENSTAVYHGFNLEYSRYLNSSFSVSGIAGFGFLPVSYAVAARDSFNGTSGYGYFSRLDYRFYSHLGLATAYRKQLNSNNALQMRLGFGLKKLAFGQTSSTYGSNVGVDFNITASTQAEANGYTTIGFGWIRSLKNRNELGINLNYEVFFRDLYRGTYSMSNNQSSGTFGSSGNNLNLGISFIFTGANKIEKMKVLRDSLQNPRQARKLYKKQIRFIHPQSIFIKVDAGLGFGVTFARDPGKKLETASLSSFTPSICIEKGITKNFFSEVGFSFLPFWSTMKFSDGYGLTGSSIFNAYQISIGAGKRFFSKNNYNIANIHAGLTVGFTDLSKGDFQSGQTAIYSGDSLNQEIIFQGSSIGSVKSSVISAAYIGVSKDFRLASNFYLTLSYRYQQGFYKLYEEKVNYTTSSGSSSQQARLFVNGSAQSYQLGLKFKIK